MKPNSRFKSGVSGNETTKWKPGQSGNPAGKSKLRLQFEENFNQALITQGSPEEAAQLLWQAARGGEPWAILDICRRFGPETQSLRLVHQENQYEVDYSKLSNEQLEQLQALLDGTQDQPCQDTGGEGQKIAA